MCLHHTRDILQCREHPQSWIIILSRLGMGRCASPSHSCQIRRSWHGGLETRCRSTGFIEALRAPQELSGTIVMQRDRVDQVCRVLRKSNRVLRKIPRFHTRSENYSQTGEFAIELRQNDWTSAKRDGTSLLLLPKETVFCCGPA